MQVLSPLRRVPVYGRESESGGVGWDGRTAILSLSKGVILNLIQNLSGVLTWTVRSLRYGRDDKHSPSPFVPRSTPSSEATDGVDCGDDGAGVGASVGVIVSW